jgi:hypothetical protein
MKETHSLVVFPMLKLRKRNLNTTQGRHRLELVDTSPSIYLRRSEKAGSARTHGKDVWVPGGTVQRADRGHFVRRRREW